MTTALEKITRLSSRVIRILGCNPGLMTLQGTNTYLIGTGKRRVLVDTGDGQQPEYFGLLRSVLQETGSSLNMVVTTHWHQDHIGGVEAILADIEPGCQVTKFPRISDTEQCKSFSQLKDGETISTEGATLKVVHTPGHTEDHIILHLQEDNIVFSGDCILGEGTAVFEDLHDYVTSLHKIQSLVPSAIYPGHGPTILDPMPRIADYLAHRMKRETQILEALKSRAPAELTAMELVKMIYVDTPEHLHNAAAINVAHHLTKLAKEKKIEVEDCEDAIKYRWKM